MRKKSIQLLLALVSVFVISKVTAQELTVCAVPQTYSALEAVKHKAPVKFKTFYALEDEILSRINNNNGICSLVISSDEKLPILLLRSNQTKTDRLKPFVTAPLILWSKDPTLFANNIDVIKNKKLKSLGLPNPHLTPVGFAAKQIVSKKTFPSEYLKHRIYRADHEFQIFSFVANQSVQAGFVTKPLIYKDGHTTGSFWNIPDDTYDPIFYYLIDTSKSNSHSIQVLFNYIYANGQALRHFYEYGFEPI